MTKIDKESNDLIQRMENWGYDFLPRPRSFNFGYGGLLVAVRETPTERHFDPETVDLKTFDEDGTPVQITLSLSSHLPKSRRAYPGRVILRDRIDKEEEFFTFGAKLDSASAPGETVYSLRSSAPVLHIADLKEVQKLLAAEVEALVARMRANWGTDDSDFARQLAKLEPLQFYAASVNSLIAHIEHTSALREELSSLYEVLVSEKKWLDKSSEVDGESRKLEELLRSHRLRAGQFQKRFSERSQ